MVIDMFGDIPMPETIRYQIEGTGKLEGYFEIFAKGFARMVGLSIKEFEEMMVCMERDKLVEILIETGIKKIRPISEYLADFKKAGLVKTCIFHDDLEFLARLKKEYGGIILSFIEIDPNGINAAEKINAAIYEIKVDGVMLIPYKYRRYANNRIYGPIYHICERMGVPIWVHSSNNWWAKAPIDYGRPIYLDKVATEFSKLKLIAGHGGWPWVNEMVAIAWKHRNVYIDTSAHRPKYLGASGSGWEMLLYFGNRIIQDKILFGSAWTLLGMPLSKVVEEFRELPLRDDVVEKILYKNAKNVFGN